MVVMGGGYAFALLLTFLARVSSKEEVLCPKPEDILPCECEVRTYDPDDIQTFMNCSAVQDEEELTRVFTADFPNNYIDDLYFDNYYNPGVRALRNGVFGNISFGGFDYLGGAIETIEGGVFEKSQQTLIYMKFRYNSFLTEFNLDGTYDLMDMFELQGTNVSEFPKLDSPRLKFLKLEGNQFTIPENPFLNLPLIEDVSIDYVGGSQLPDILFTEVHTNLDEVVIVNDNITYLQVGPFENVNINNVLQLDFNNDVFEMEEGALSGLQKVDLQMFATNVNTLEEHLWRPLLEKVVKLVLSEITCDCSVKWLIDEPELIDMVKYTTDGFEYQPAKCSSGENLADLDPADFEDC